MLVYPSCLIQWWQLLHYLYAYLCFSYHIRFWCLLPICCNSVLEKWNSYQETLIMLKECWGRVIFPCRFFFLVKTIKGIFRFWLNLNLLFRLYLVVAFDPNHVPFDCKCIVKWWNRLSNKIKLGRQNSWILIKLQSSLYLALLLNMILSLWIKFTFQCWVLTLKT